MRTTLNIDDELPAEVLGPPGEKDKGRAVNKALDEFVREKIERLTDGSIPAAALEGDQELLTFDPDSQRIPGLRFYQPGGGTDA